MKNRSLLTTVGCALLALILAACGGGGSREFSPAARQVQDLQRRSLLSFANSGLVLPGFAGGGGGTSGGTTGAGTSGGSNGGGGGFPSMGGYFRNMGNGGPGMFGGIGTSGGTSSGTTGTGGFEDFYFDPYLSLWVQVTATETTFDSLFYTDEAKQHPAGQAHSTFAANWNTYPQEYTSTYEYTAGLLAGAHGTYVCTAPTPTDGSMTYNNTYVDGSHDEGESNWTETDSSWQSSWTGADGAWYHDNGAWHADGTADYACSNSNGWSANWHYNADGSGSAHIEGPDPLLPAEMTWTASGHYRIVWADGTIEEWDWSDWYGGGTTGNSGSTGVGTTGETTAGTTTTGSNSGTTTGSNSSSTTGG